jgi:hypothetical protein
MAMAKNGGRDLREIFVPFNAANLQSHEIAP